MGSLANADEKYFKHQQPYWNLNIDHTTYDEVWQSRAIWKHLKAIKPAVMLVGGWYDTEDPQGLLRQFDFMEKNTPPRGDMLVMGPWNHGGFSRGDGDRLGNVNFGSKTGLYYREHIEFPFFLYYLKGKGDGKFPKAWLFQTGLNQWRKLRCLAARSSRSPATCSWMRNGKLSLAAAGGSRLRRVSRRSQQAGALRRPHRSGRAEHLYDRGPALRRRRGPTCWSTRPKPLDHDVTVFGPISVDLKVSTTGTDSDFVVKVIDVYPGDYPDYNNSQPGRSGRAAPLRPPNAVPMGGYQQLIRGEPFRGKFRKSFEKPVPFEPGKPDRITFYLPDIAHTLRAGPSHHGADSELLVPADGSQSAEVHGDSQGALDRFREGHAARLFRRARTARGFSFGWSRPAKPRSRGRRLGPR